MPDSSEVAIIMSAVAASIATIIYSCKHVRKSQCCGNTCVQAVDGLPETPRRKSDAIVLAPVPMREPSPVLTPPSVWEWLVKNQVKTQVDKVSTEV
tara:strand:- start:175 stop:462 length:288 start_codon:yes stop_codon:yes gene_type:complete